MQNLRLVLRGSFLLRLSKSTSIVTGNWKFPSLNPNLQTYHAESNPLEKSNISTKSFLTLQRYFSTTRYLILLLFLNRRFSSGNISIGGISLPISEPKDPILVPGFNSLVLSNLEETNNYWKSDTNDGAPPTISDMQETLQDLRWMLQKDKIGQDMLLIGPPGICYHVFNLTNQEQRGEDLQCSFVN